MAVVSKPLKIEKFKAEHTPNRRDLRITTQWHKPGSLIAPAVACQVLVLWVVHLPTGELPHVSGD
jgi:hypothetical protein